MHLLILAKNKNIGLTLNKGTMKFIYKFLLDNIREFESLQVFAKPAATIITLILLFLLAWLGHFIAKKIFVQIVTRLARRTKTSWDDMLVKRKAFRNLAHLVPAIILYYAAHFSSPEMYNEMGQLSESALNVLSRDYNLSLAGMLIKAAQIYFVFIFVFVLNSLLNAGLDIYNTTAYSKHRPVKGYIQLFKILVFSLSAILIISILLERDPTVLLAGLGAMGAVLMLIFKDTILGFVSSIQLSGNNMVKIGDWIEMRSRGADGTVTDITLNTVKVRNWDNTISTIPTYSMVSESFINWKGMEESGGRRIKRAVNIDMNSIKLCDSDLLNRLQKFLLIRDYVIEKEKEIREYNKKKNISDDDVISGRGQTNIGIFRKYLELYLHQHPMVNDEMTFLVRHLNPSEKGLPVEIYVFCKEKAWARYEAVQADIFDHILAIIPEFDLRVFQEPTGSDLMRACTKN
jgi:miniconductance mechanosensitive channel